MSIKSTASFVVIALVCFACNNKSSSPEQANKMAIADQQMDSAVNYKIADTSYEQRRLETPIKKTKIIFLQNQLIGIRKL